MRRKLLRGVLPLKSAVDQEPIEYEVFPDEVCADVEELSTLVPWVGMKLDLGEDRHVDWALFLERCDHILIWIV